MLSKIIRYGFPILFLVMGLVTMIYYGLDKRAAIKGKRRTPEKVLFALNLAGGFLGGWIGMNTFRHKTKHPKFYAVQLISTVLWLGLWIFLVIKTK